MSTLTSESKPSSSSEWEGRNMAVLEVKESWPMKRKLGIFFVKNSGGSGSLWLEDLDFLGKTEFGYGDSVRNKLNGDTVWNYKEENKVMLRD